MYQRSQFQRPSPFNWLLREHPLTISAPACSCGREATCRQPACQPHLPVSLWWPQASRQRRDQLFPMHPHQAKQTWQLAGLKQMQLSHKSGAHAGHTDTLGGPGSGDQEGLCYRARWNLFYTRLLLSRPRDIADLVHRNES